MSPTNNNDLNSILFVDVDDTTDTPYYTDFTYGQDAYTQRQNQNRQAVLDAANEEIRRNFDPLAIDDERVRDELRRTIPNRPNLDRINRFEPPPLVLPEGRLSQEDQERLDELLRKRRDLVALGRQEDFRLTSLEEGRNISNRDSIEGIRRGIDVISLNIGVVDEDIAKIGSRVSTLRLKTKVDGNGVFAPLGENVLNRYMDVQYHISLTMLSEDDARSVQYGLVQRREIDIDTLRGESRQNRSVTLASTGDQFRNDLIGFDAVYFADTSGEQVETQSAGARTPDRNYYNIESMQLENVYAPSAANPLVSTMTMMKMKIVEPHGFKLHEDIRDTALALRYRDINPGRIVYRVDVFFSGWDQDTGQWVEQIRLGDSESFTVISYYVAISRIEASVDARGTIYDVDLVPAGHFAYRPEEIVIDANSVFTGENDTFGEFLTQLETTLNAAKLNRTQGIIKREYRFYAPELLRGASFKAKEFAVEKNYIQENTRGGNMLTIGRDVDLLTMLQGALANTPLVQDYLISDIGNDNFTNPRVMFTVRFNTKYGNRDGAPGVNTSLNDYDVITYEYIIEPFLSFKKGTVTVNNIEAVMASENQVRRVKEILKYGMFNRIYNYIYTAENTEVLDFDVKLKTFYYYTLNTAYDNTHRIGIASTDEASSVEQRRRTTQQSQVARTILDNLTPRDQSSINQTFGDVDQSNASSAGRSAYEKFGGGFNDTQDVDYFTGTSTAGSPRKNSYVTYLDDHLRNDLLTLEGMTIKGDPIWLLSPYANQSLDYLEFANQGSDGVVFPRTGKVIFLRLFAPNQNDHMNPTRGRASSYPNIVGGFYEITTIKSSFESGKFVQSIEGVKLNHLNYVEELFEFTSSRTPDSSAYPSYINPSQAEFQEGR